MRLSQFSPLALIATVAMSLVIFAGCSTIENSPNTARLAVGYATLKVIENSSVEHRQERRARINSIAHNAKSFLSGNAVTLPLLEVAIRTQVDFNKLSPADQYLADALIKAVIGELQARVGTGLLDPAQVLAVNMVLDWVIEATAVAPYKASTTPVTGVTYAVCTTELCGKLDTTVLLY